MKFRFHCMGLPHTVTHIEYNACAYTMKVLKFCKMMKKRGHTIYHYGHADSVVECDEHISVTDNDVLLEAYGSYDWKKEFFKHNITDYANVTFNKRAIEELRTRLQPKDIVLLFWGYGHKPIYDEFKDINTIICEPGIGYFRSFARMRAFESWSIYNYEHGTNINSWPGYYDTVIPNYFDVREFEFNDKKHDYFLCLGRIDKCKGVHTAISAINALPPHVPRPRLVIAGQGDITQVWEGTLPDFVILYGYASVNQRKELMKNAACLILLSMYLEPFGGVVIEAGLSGTPVITNNWGAFTEIVVHGVTGWRIQNQAEIIWAIRNIHKILPRRCYDIARERYSLEAVAPLFEKFFKHCSKLLEKPGWYLEDKCSMDPDGITPFESPLPWEKDVRPKIAIYCEGKWACGRIYSALIKYARNLYDFTWYNWDVPDDNEAFIKFHDKFNLIITTSPLRPEIYEQIKDTNPNILLVDHSPLSLREYPVYGTLNKEHILKDPNVTVGSVEKRTDCIWLPTGVDIDKFRVLKRRGGGEEEERGASSPAPVVKRIGFVGCYPNSQEEMDSCPKIRTQNEIKRPQLFLDMCAHAGVESVILTPTTEITDDPAKIYGDIDMLICCSKEESGPLGVFEAAACGIPVLSTRVGLLTQIRSMEFIPHTDLSGAGDFLKTFISTHNLNDYRDLVTREIREEWSFEKLIETYWVPAINKKITVYNKTP